MFKRVTPRQRINQLPATAVNTLFTMIEERNRRDQKGSGSAETGDPTIVLVKNNTGSPLATSFGIVSIGDVVINRTDGQASFEREHIFDGDTPTASSTAIAIVQEPLSADKIGRAVVQGVAVVRLNVVDSADTHASPTTSTTELTTGTSGIAKILWKESGTGSGKWAKVLLLNAGTNDTAIEYEAYNLEADYTSIINNSYVSLDNWVQLSDYSTDTRPEIPSTGYWEVIAHITGRVTCAGDTSTAAASTELWARIGVTGGDGVVIAPLGSDNYGIVAGAVATNAAGAYAGSGTVTLAMIVRADVAGCRITTACSAINATAAPLTWTVLGTSYSTILMRKLGEL